MKPLLKIGILILKFIYGIFKLFPVKDRVVILSRQSDSPSTDINLLYRKIQLMHPDYDVIVLSKKFVQDSTAFKKLLYIFHILRQMWYLSTSKIAVLDSYCIPVSLFKHRKSLLIVQMWHSIGTMKKFAYSIVDKAEGSSSEISNLMKMHRGYDYIFAAGDGYRAHLAEGFGYPIEKVIVMPLPRVELLKSANYREKVRKEIFAKYTTLDNGKLNVIYAPTFRKVNDKRFDMALEALCSDFDYSSFNLIVKPHPLTNVADINLNQAIMDNRFSTFDLLFASDILITDYSCIMYEAAILRLPIYFYAYDFDEYMSSRDTYIDYKSEVPGPVFYDARSLISKLKEPGYDFDKLDSFLNKYVSLYSKSETEEIVNFLFSHSKQKSEPTQ